MIVRSKDSRVAELHGVGIVPWPTFSARKVFLKKHCNIVVTAGSKRAYWGNTIKKMPRLFFSFQDYYVDPHNETTFLAIALVCVAARPEFDFPAQTEADQLGNVETDLKKAPPLPTPVSQVSTLSAL